MVNYKIVISMFVSRTIKLANERMCSIFLFLSRMHKSNFVTNGVVKKTPSLANIISYQSNKEICKFNTILLTT